jgi:hypothetical protein
MPSPEPDNAVHLKNAQAQARQLAAMAGLSALLVVPIGATFVAQGNWVGLFFLAIPAVAVAVGKWFARITPEDYAVLYGDRMELPGYGKKKTVFHWSDVRRIRWPTRRDLDAPIRVMVPRGKERIAPWIPLELNNVSAADRVRLIRYLRERGAEVEQEGWPKFCYRHAIPLVEACQRAEAALGAEGAPETCPSLPGTYGPWLSRLVRRHPFLAGMLGPLWILSLVSRKMWWTTSAMIGLSAVINIGLVWGRWAFRLTGICLGFAAAMFLAGFLAPRETDRSKNADEQFPSAPYWLALVVIGMPLLANAGALGWVPPQLAEYGVMGGILILFAPGFIYLRKRSQRDRQRGPALEADALRRWAVY